MAKMDGHSVGLACMFSSSSYIRTEIEQRRDMLYAIAFSWCHDPVLADDLVQETMLKALRNARQLKDSGAIKSWLGRILTNSWYDHLRKSRDTVDLDSLHFEDYDNHADTHDHRQHIIRILYR